MSARIIPHKFDAMTTIAEDAGATDNLKRIAGIALV
jgi:hypothetical protein